MSHQISTKRVGLNIASQWTFSVINMVVNFFLIGYVVAKVGMEHYGGWTSIVAIISCLATLDAGMSVAIQYYVARLYVSKHEKELISLFSSAYVIYVIAAVLSLVSCLVISHYYPLLFPKVPVKAATEISVALRWISLSMLFYMLNLPIQGSLRGLQRHYMRNIIEALSLLVRALVVFVAFAVDSPSLSHLGFAFFVATVVRFVASKIVLSKVASHLRFHPSLVTKASLRQLFSYSGHSFFWTIATVVVRESGPIVANIMLDATSATYLFIGTKLVQALGAFITSAAQVFVPVASSLRATNDDLRLRSVLIRGTRLCCLLGLGCAAVLIIFGRSILYHWVGFTDNTGYIIVIIMTLGRLPTWIFNAALSMLMGMRQLWSITSMLIVSTVSCLILMPVLSHFYGVYGLAVGLIVPLAILYSIWVPWRASRVCAIKVRHLLRHALPAPIFVTVCVIVFSCVIQQAYQPNTIAILIAELAGAMIIIGGLGLYKGLDKPSRDMLISKLSSQSSRLRKSIDVGKDDINTHLE